jgi:hypothetical protein
MPDVRWVGWLREPGGRWRRLVEAPTIGEAARRLTQATADMRPQPHNLDECLTQGAPPCFERRPEP